jgi:hypothetical protein
VRAEYVPVNPTSTFDVTGRPAYQAASLDNTGRRSDAARLSSRSARADRHSKWAFADCAATPFPGKSDGGKVCLEGGLDTDHIYELVYTAKDPTVAGLGFAATRDFGAFLRGDSADQSVANPLAAGIDHTLIFGSSQSGRWIRTFIHLGFNENESHKRVFDGAIPHKASNRGTFNVRFAQSTRLSGTQHIEAQYPGQESPQTFDVSTDAIAGGNIPRNQGFNVLANRKPKRRPRWPVVIPKRKAARGYFGSLTQEPPRTTFRLQSPSFARTHFRGCHDCRRSNSLPSTPTRCRAR